MLVAKIVSMTFQKFEGCAQNQLYFYSHTSVGLSVPSLCLGKVESMMSYQITSMRINKSDKNLIGELFSLIFSPMSESGTLSMV